MIPRKGRCAGPLAVALGVSHRSEPARILADPDRRLDPSGSPAACGRGVVPALCLLFQHNRTNGARRLSCLAPIHRRSPRLSPDSVDTPCAACLGSSYLLFFYHWVFPWTRLNRMTSSWCWSFSPFLPVRSGLQRDGSNGDGPGPARRRLHDSGPIDCGSFTIQ